MSGHECDTCDRTFNTWKSCMQHMTAVDHWIWEYECETCSSRFLKAYQRDQHMKAKNHYSYDYECETCNLAFRDEEDRDDHQEDEGHYKALHCSDCDRYFQSVNNLSQHMKSRMHQGANILCPFCNSTFATASGVSHHLENSACPKAPNVNRTAIHRMLRQRDTSGIITERLLTYHHGNNEDVHWEPTSAWNGNFYECYICHREFRTPVSLNQHLTSAAHQAPLCHCPNKNGTCGGKRFPTLAALFNHLESESCGYVKFSAVQKNVHGFLSGGRQNLIAL